MSSDTMDEEEIIPLLFDEEYNKTCDEEINGIVPKLERLRINDCEVTDLSSGFSIHSFESSILNFEGTSIANLNEVPPIFVGEISVNEDTKAVADNKESLSETEKSPQVFATNTQIEISSQDVIPEACEGREIHVHPINVKDDQTTDETNETKEENVYDERPLDFSLQSNSEHDNEDRSNSDTSGNKAELKSIKFPSQEKKHVDAETGEIIQDSITEFQDTSDGNSQGKTLDQFSDEMAIGIVSDVDSSILTYSADVSMDDQSDSSNGIVLDSPPDTSEIDAAKSPLVKKKRSRKIATSNPPFTGMSEIRKRRFGIFQSPSGIIDASKEDSSDKDSKNSSAIKNQSPTNYRRKRTVKSSPKPAVLNPSGVKNEENRPGSCKRKKTLSENATEAAGKYRKRSISEHNLETGESTHSVIRSRSLSSGKKSSHNTQCSTSSRSRKRTNSNSHNTTRIKLRKSPTSSDDTENK